MFKQITALVVLAIISLSCISCDTTNAKVGLPIPFTNPAIRVNLETQIAALPPKICVGLDIVED